MHAFHVIFKDLFSAALDDPSAHLRLWICAKSPHAVWIAVATAEADMLNPVGFSEKMKTTTGMPNLPHRSITCTVGLAWGQRQSVKGRGQAVKSVTVLLLAWKKPPINLTCPPQDEADLEFPGEVISWR